MLHYFSKSSIFTLGFLTAFMAVFLQVQLTLFADGDYRGLRIGAADICMPFIGLCVLWSLWRKKTKWPQWFSSRKIIWILSLVLVMSVALLNGYIVSDAFSSWAFINKYIGFFLLLSYFFLGNWIAANVEDRQHIYAVFMRWFVGFFVAVMCATILALVLQPFTPFSLWMQHYPWDGFMVNRNAFMVIFVLVFSFVIWDYAAGSHSFPRWMLLCFWLSMPLFFVFNESRTGWIVAAILGCIFFLKNPLIRAKKVIPLLIVGVGLAYGSYYIVTDQVALAFNGDQLRHLLNVSDAPDEIYMGDQKRYIAIEDGVDLYMRYNPLVGAGLGSYQPFQIEKRGESIEIMDFTALWLLVETGGLGLLTFVSFFAYCAWLLYREGYCDKPSNYHRAMFIFLLLFAGMSVLHELMYTRVLWFSMGLALAVQTNKKEC